MIENEFDNDTKYRLYRTVREILHPTISKRNISDYVIIMNEDVLPIRVFYPQKISELHKIVLFIHGNGSVTSSQGEYSNICKDISKKLDKLIIGIEYNEEKSIKDIIEDLDNTISYIYDGLDKNNKDEEDIIIMSDSTGCLLMDCLHNKEISKRIKKEIYCYPVIDRKIIDSKKYPSVEKNMEFNPILTRRIEDFFNHYDIKENNNNSNINTLVLIGSIDPILDGVKDYYQDLKNYKVVELPFANHGFLKDMDQELEEEFYKEINDFI